MLCLTCACRYHDHGYVFAYIRDFEGMDSGRITANVVEGKVNHVNVVYVDENGNPKKTGGETPVEVVERELPFRVRPFALTTGAGDVLKP